MYLAITKITLSRMVQLYCCIVDGMCYYLLLTTTEKTQHDQMCSHVK